MLPTFDRRRALALLGASGLSLATLVRAQAPRRGGTAVIALIQEPGSLNRFLTPQTGAILGKIVVEGLFEPRANGSYVPVLAAEVPSTANGGVSADGLSLRLRLRPGLKWSDGQPLSADDLVFTFRAYADPGSTPAGDAMTPAWKLIDSVTKVDPLTVQVRMKRPNPSYLELFNVVLPQHKFEGQTAVTNQHLQSRMPLGTGPFLVKEWRTGDAIVFERNPNYREAGKPYLDQVVARIVPNREVAIQGLLRGEVDTIFFPVTGDLPGLLAAEKEGRKVKVALQGTKSWVEWLWLNQSDGGDPARPHPVLGDAAVREALDLGLNRAQILQQVFGGLGHLTGSLIYSGWAAVDLPATAHDPQRAAQRLDAAGWARGSDGIRSKGGTRASLRFQTIAGDRTRELYQQLIQQSLRDVGIELKIQNVPSNVLFGAYKDGGLIKRGNYDIAMSRAGYVIDPVSWVNLFTTDQIPSASNPEGGNTVFYSNAEFDRLALQAATVVDQAERRQLYTRVAERWARDRPALPLYSSAWGWAWSTRLQGVSVDHWQGMWPVAADWHLAA
jgi:peptide/nickel transport system substrate-binding protein